jgi:energy-converting hydrogenase Eha subunit C
VKKEQLKTIIYLAERLKERSTWLGITAILSSAGVFIEPELLNKIVMVGMTIAGLICIFTKDFKYDTRRRSSIRKKSRTALQEPPGASNRTGLPVEPATPVRSFGGQEVSRKF